MSEMQLSYSSLNLLLTCEERYAHYKVYGSPQDSDYEDGDALGLGKAFHQALENVNHNKFVPELLREAMKEHQVDDSDYPLLSAMVQKYVKLHKLSGLKIIKCELGIDYKKYKGFIDAIGVDESGKWWIVDLKTTGRWDDNLLPRLARDMQLNLYSAFVTHIAPILELKVEDFAGCRYRAVTKPKLVFKSKETEEQYIERLIENCKVYDVEIPVSMLNPAHAWDVFLSARERAVNIHDGEVPQRNYQSCFNYFRPCPYFSKCHGEIFSKNGSRVKVHTLESFEQTNVL